MSLKKKYLKTKPVCKVTFKVDFETLPETDSVALVGEFNDWDAEAQPMKKLKNGNFKTSMDLPVGSTYAFRYLVGGTVWMNEDEADAYVPTGMGPEKNSVIKL